MSSLSMSIITSGASDRSILPYLSQLFARRLKHSRMDVLMSPEAIFPDILSILAFIQAESCKLCATIGSQKLFYSATLFV